MQLVDDSRNTSKLKPFINSKGWEYEIYHDPNSDLKELRNNPFLILFYLMIKWKSFGQNCYTDGHELELYDKLLELSK